MVKKNQESSKPEQSLRRGDVVRFSYGMRFVTGVVLEDRGPLGTNKETLYLIEFPPSKHDSDLFHIELPAKDLEKLSSAVEAK